MEDKKSPILDPRFSGFKMDQAAGKLMNVIIAVKDFESAFKNLSEVERAAFGGMTINIMCIWSDFSIVAEYGNIVTLNYLDLLDYENHKNYRKPPQTKPVNIDALVDPNKNKEDKVIN